jgi:hypothetical protein
MKKREVDHVLRAAGNITREKQFIIVGSQSLHGKYPDLADEIVRSAEVGLSLRALHQRIRAEGYQTSLSAKILGLLAIALMCYSIVSSG